ncbi:MAG: hypothetical protein ACTHN0_10360 [Aquihabitans sp.]
MHRTPLRAVLLVSIACLLFAGCGASGGDDAADEPTTTQSEATTTTETDTTEVDTTDVETTDVETTEADDPAGDEICEPLQVLSDFDAESAQLIDEGDWPTIQAYFVDHTDDVLTAYDDAIALDTDLSDDLEELRSITAGTADLAAESSSLEELGTKLLDDPDIASAGEAGFRLNEFAEETCGFSTGGN